MWNTTKQDSMKIFAKIIHAIVSSCNIPYHSNKGNVYFTLVHTLFTLKSWLNNWCVLVFTLQITSVWYANPHFNGEGKWLLWTLGLTALDVILKMIEIIQGKERSRVKKEEGDPWGYIDNYWNKNNSRTGKVQNQERRR